MLAKKVFFLTGYYKAMLYMPKNTGKDRDDYIETARRKAHDLKEYIDVLFDWFKLNSNEFANYLGEKYFKLQG